ncbi:mediator of DNA damage checkpoint protein 1-like [Lytechinus variegatus]|uniref:mediator of DNA damage checkpoint protein 1-like n=1 Tax=Lytechinus variegatus TaxID=7654 RepID=UPI001BB15D49|nr:mediator of DNA damage checkpoint protein 1-like [Lytechinus variegatus]XP_041484153.1 mediator of DNA damage checkpoint protein 1-like [Lytechinus variegatus]XP_041484154.1 mediator of DNA damage checkpoint protein 1-like [Lytechinus variegatus]XP_041484155.1 mediator of DNA damage checkpoint protein 1-like [Lytechinus variegatus]
MDATQAIIFSDEEDSEQEQGSGEKNAVAFLHVLAQKELSAVKHPIYEGDNYIGRHDSNSIHMPFKALSKQHACIEVQGNSHLIYDMESRNKTRRGKMFLKPNVRYELRDDDVITFGDVKCQYILQSEQEEDDDDTGSDTDSELMLQPPDSEDLDQDDYKRKEDENDNESSFSINDFIQPTQPCIQNGAIDVIATQAVDNMETQAVDNMATLAVDSPETQAIDDMETQAVDNMATLAVDSPVTQAIDGMETQAVDNMATLAVDSPEPQDIDGMETQAVDNMATLAVDNSETQAVDGMETQAVDNMATLAVDNLETQSVDGMETQAIDNMATLAVDCQATQAVDGVETQAVDGMETQAVDNMATLAVDNLETQAIDYGIHSDSSDTDIDDDVRQSILEAPTQAVALNDSRQQGTPIKECTRTLVLDSSADSSDIDDSPVKQARNVYDDPTQICDSVVSDSGSETDIEDPSMIPETQADVTGASEVDEMATIAIDQDDEILKDRREDKTDSSEGDRLNAPQPPSSDDNTELDSDMGNTSQEYFLNYRTNEAPGDETPSNPADIEVPSRAADIEATQPYQGHSDDDNTDEMPSKPSDIEPTQPYQGHPDDDNTDEMPSKPSDIEPTQPYQGHPDGDSADETPSRPDDIEATQPYQGLLDDEGTEEPTPTNQDKVNVTNLEATQRYGDINKDKTTEEPTPALSVTMEMPSSATMVFPSTQADDAKEKQPDSCDDDETDPTVPYHTGDDVAMETGDSEIESTQAYGMQGGNTQVPDSQDGDDEPTSSRFPVFKTQSPSKSCLKQPNTPDRKATKARRVMFQSTEDEESSQETDGDTEPLKRSVRSRGQAKGSKSLGVDEEQSTSKGSRRSSSRVSQRKEDEEVKEAQNVVSGRKGRRSKTVEDAAMKPGQKRKADALEQPSASSAMVNKVESNTKREKKQGRHKIEDEIKEDTVDGALTVTDAKPTRKKDFDEENPRPSSGKESKVKDKRKLSDSSISSVGSEGSKAGRALRTIVQIGKKLTRGSKRGKKSVGGGESTNDSLPVVTKTLQSTAEVIDDGDSDDTASISSTASSIRDFEEAKPSTIPTRGTRSRRSKVADEPDSQSSSGIRRSQRGGTEKKEMTPPEESKKKVGGRAKKGVAPETVVTEVDGPSTQSSSRTRRSERSTQGDELTSQDDSQKGVSTRGKKSEKNEEEVKSRRTRRGAMQDAKPDTQETNPKGNENIKAVELKSEMGKTSKRGKTKAQSSAEGEQNVSADASIREDKESQEAGSKRKRNATSESQEGSTKDTTEVNVRQSGRRRTLPARFVDSEVKGKDGEKKAASEHEVEDKTSADAGVFAVPKAVGRPSRKTQKKEPSPSSQGEVESEMVQTSSRGRRSTAKVKEEVAEKEKSEQPVKENTRGSRKRGQEVLATKPAADSKGEETMATPKQRRGLAAAVNTSEGPSKVEMSEDLKEDAKESRRRGRQKPTEDAAASEKILVTPSSRRGQTSVAASPAKTSKDAERDEQSKEAKSTEAAKMRGKRGATSLTPSPTSSPSSAAKRSRQTAVSSPSISPARRSTQRRVGENKPKVMFTGVMDDSWQKAVTTLGGELGNSVDDCTHLVTDKVRRTVKFLCSMARGIVIVKPTWLDASMKAKAFIDPSPYQLKDKAAERQYSFSLNVSLDKAKETKLFDGYKLHVTPGVKPDPQQMKDIIRCAGGEYVAKLPTKHIPQLVIVSCDGDKSLWAGPRKAGIPVVSSEFILTGILRQAILLDDYQLK